MKIMRFRIWQGAVILGAALILLLFQFNRMNVGQPTGMKTMSPPVYSGFEQEDGDVRFFGHVTSIDRSQLPLDGDAIIKVSVGTGRVVTVRIPAGERVCEAADNIISLDEIRIGDGIVVRGKPDARGDIVVCTSIKHYVCGPEPPEFCAPGTELRCVGRAWQCI